MRRQILCSLSLVLIIFFQQQEIRAATTEAAVLPKYVLTLNWKPEPQFGGFYTAAVVERVFAKKGFQIEIVPGGSGTPTLQMLLNNKTQLAIVSADEVVTALDRGAKDILALFAVFQTNPQAIMTHAQKKYASLSDVFKDEKSTLLWQSGLPYAQYLTKKLGAPKGKVAPYLGGLTNFIHDENIQQQCFAISEPLLAEKNKIASKVFLVADEGYNPYTTVLVTTKKFQEENPQMIAQIIEGFRQGWTSYLHHESAQKQTHLVMNQLNPAMSIADMKAAAQAQMPLIETKMAQGETLGNMTPARWQELADQLFALGVIKTKVSLKGLLLPPSSTNSR